MASEKYIAGEGARCWVSLCRAIESCKDRCGTDPAYKDIFHKLDLVRQELDWVTLSPGRRAVLRSAMPNHAGQEPMHLHDEGAMEVQRNPKTRFPRRAAAS